MLLYFLPSIQNIASTTFPGEIHISNPYFHLSILYCKNRQRKQGRNLRLFDIFDKEFIGLYWRLSWQIKGPCGLIAVLLKFVTLTMPHYRWKTGGAVCNVSYWHVGVQDGFDGHRASKLCSNLILMTAPWRLFWSRDGCVLPYPCLVLGINSVP